MPYSHTLKKHCHVLVNLLLLRELLKLLKPWILLPYPTLKSNTLEPLHSYLDLTPTQSLEITLNPGLNELGMLVKPINVIAAHWLVSKNSLSCCKISFSFLNCQVYTWLVWFPSEFHGYAYIKLEWPSDTKSSKKDIVNWIHTHSRLCSFRSSLKQQ